jgi:hypothetical protein
VTGSTRGFGKACLCASGKVKAMHSKTEGALGGQQLDWTLEGDNSERPELSRTAGSTECNEINTHYSTTIGYWYCKLSCYLKRGWEKVS